MRATLAIYGSHNASVALAIDGQIVRVVEIERLLGVKNIGLYFYYSTGFADNVLREIARMFERDYGIKRYDTVISEYIPEHALHSFPAREYVRGYHHTAHASGSLYQSNHNEALIFSFDGGGTDFDGYVFFRAYYGRRGEDLQVLKTVPYDFGFPYMAIGHYIKDIRQEPLYLGNFVYPGKLMGYCGYGEARDDWRDPMMEFFKSNPDGPEGHGSYQQKLDKLGSHIGVTFDMENRLNGQVAKDVAASAQAVFEEVFIEQAHDILEQNPDLPVHITGGCGLNILLNTRLKQQLDREVFVTPNPNDGGLAVGMLCDLLRPLEQVDITYKGLPVLDEFNLAEYGNHLDGKFVNLNIIVEDLAAGKIVGVVQGDSEHGPRALGNRSIICDASIKGMKDKLNAKVKHRENFRPFSPTVRLEDVSQYFHWTGESRWMTFCPAVKEEWKSKLESITHVDGTARVQTVTKDQHPFFYELLSTLNYRTGIGVLLNTSFNVAGKPILSTYRDAVKVFKETEMDCLLLGDYYIRK